MDPTDTIFRHCLACHYNLTGLGDGPRCPECGLVHVPQAFREEVWKLVDSGKWFFSRMFHPFEKRPPGWWWALDRPGDVRRSFLFAGCMVVTSLALLMAAWWALCSVRIETTDVEYWIDPTGLTSHEVALEGVSTPQSDRFQLLLVPAAPGAACPVTLGDSIPIDKQLAAALAKPVPDGSVPCGVRITELRSDLFNDTTICSLVGMIPKDPPRSSSHSPPFRWRYVNDISSRFHFHPHWCFGKQTFIPLVIFVMTWLAPAYAGVCSQIHRGLPSFAKAPRTIAAAAGYESHRLIYLSALLCSLAILIGLLGVSRPTLRGQGSEIMVFGAMVAGFLFSAAGWVGPLKSDYTMQLLRSRGQAVRIFSMYAVGVPLLMGAAATALLNLALWDW